MKQSAESYLPLTPAKFHVLLALADSEKHGYAIMKEVERQSDNSVRLGAGTLYGILKRLVDERMIVELRGRRLAGEDERRRIYRLKEFGRRVAQAEAERLRSAVSLARAKKLLERLA